MTELQGSLAERREEFDTHFALALALEGRIVAGEVVSIGETELSARHLMTIKSGLVVHLYNVVESIMSRTIETVGGAVGGVPPNDWSEKALREWLRRYAAVGIDGSEDTRLETIHGASQNLLSGEALGPQSFKKPSGTWSDKLIARFADRLGVSFHLPPEMWGRIKARPEYGDKTPMEFLAGRRNELAHGRRSFEDGARDMTLPEIRELSDITLDYLELAVHAFQAYVDNRHYMAATP